jgi:ubiquinone/menaquinone biosynthesis C-methylase UbiE
MNNQLYTTASKNIDGARKNVYRGGIEIICKEYVTGYCFDASTPDEPVCLRVLMDEIELGKTWAKLEKIHYHNLGIGNGRCGFYYRFTENHQIVDLNRIRVVPVDDTLPLRFIHTKRNNKASTLDIQSSLSEGTASRAARFNDIFIVNHIPKTAGTSLRSSLDKQFSAQQSLYHYFGVGVCSPDIWNWKFAEQPKLKFEDVVKNIIERPISLIMGHFGYPEQHGFDKFFNAFPLARSISFFREPYDHVCSLYTFACKYFSESKSFEKYIEQGYVRNYQTNALCGVSIDQLSFAGIVEYYNESLDVLYETLGLKLDPAKVNVNEKKSRVGYNYSQFGNGKVWARFEELNQADIELYQQAKNRLKEHIDHINSNDSPELYGSGLIQQKKKTVIPDFTWAKSLSKVEWAKSLSDGKGPNGEALPSFPPVDVQAKFVGSNGYDAFLDAITFIEKMKNRLVENGLEIRKNTLTLDCGVGWGRIYQAMLREVEPASILGVDIDSEAIKMCEQSMPYGRFELISKNPPYENLQEASFDIVYLYSVFSHLSETGFRSMMAEFSRITKKGGFLVFTTLKRVHLNVWNSHGDSSAYAPALKAAGYNFKKWQDLADRGGFLFVPTGGGDPSRPNDYYGETIITEQYLNREKASFGFALKAFENPDDMAQAFVVMQKL